MAAISRTTFSYEFYWMKKSINTFIKISLKFIPKGPIYNNVALVSAWRRIGDKPLSKPMLSRSTDAYMRGIDWNKSG